MICLICGQAETAEGRISLHFVRGETNLTVNHVPSYVCPVCGEGYVDEDVAVSLLQGAEALFRSGRIENICDYEELDSSNQN